MNQIVVCSDCQAEYLMDGALQERPLAEMERVVQVGLLCPQCGAWAHAHFDTPQTKRFRASLNLAIALFQKQRTQRTLKALRRAQTAYQEVFDQEQARIRPLVGVQSPTAVLGQDVCDVVRED